MSCRTFEALLAGHLDGRLSPTARRRFQEHLADCPRCRALEAAARGPLQVPAMKPPANLVASVLERTSGRVCGRAQALLCERVDGSLAAMEGDLVAGHMASCAECMAVARVLSLLREDLPSLCRATPDARFCRDVLARTRPLDRRLVRRLRRWYEDSMSLLRRPRFALEAAYIGAAVLALVFGTPFSPLRETPRRALALVQVQPGQAPEASPLAGVPARVTAWTRSGWETGGPRVAGPLGILKNRLSSHFLRAAGAGQQLPSHGRQLGAALVHLDFPRTWATLAAMGADLGAVWKELTTPEHQETHQEAKDMTPRN
ncbi:MAG: anti-sigma factor family protein [Acidobacteriota bacterium]